MCLIPVARTLPSRKLLKKRRSGKQCPAIDGIIKEVDATAGEIEDEAVLDAATVANAQAVCTTKVPLRDADRMGRRTQSRLVS